MAGSGISNQNLSVLTGITALAGGANSASTPVLTGKINVVSVCATAADSAALPAAQSQGTEVVIRNNGAAACAVFPNTGGTINGGSANASVSVTNAKGATFFQVGTDGLTWVTAALAA
jgi:hypothetical protein